MSEEREIHAALAANALFYEALAQGDGPAMEALWATTEPVICTHPGAATLHGRAAVMQSWEAILSAPPAIEFADAQVALIRGLAFVTCSEQIGEAVLAATNVFVWEDGAWRMAHHHAGQVAHEQSQGPGPGEPLH